MMSSGRRVGEINWDPRQQSSDAPALGTADIDAGVSSRNSETSIGLDCISYAGVQQLGGSRRWKEEDAFHLALDIGVRNLMHCNHKTSPRLIELPST